MEECNCEFEPAPEGEDPDLCYHYRRYCPNCGEDTLSLHCIHDGMQGLCGHCGDRLPDVRYAYGPEGKLTRKQQVAVCVENFWRFQKTEEYARAKAENDEAMMQFMKSVRPV